MASPYELRTRWLEWHEIPLESEDEMREFLMRVPIDLLREVLEERLKVTDADTTGSN